MIKHVQQHWRQTSYRHYLDTIQTSTRQRHSDSVLYLRNMNYQQITNICKYIKMTSGYHPDIIQTSSKHTKTYPNISKHIQTWFRHLADTIQTSYRYHPHFIRFYVVNQEWQHYLSPSLSFAYHPPSPLAPRAGLTRYGLSRMSASRRVIAAAAIERTLPRPAHHTTPATAWFISWFSAFHDRGFTATDTVIPLAICCDYIHTVIESFRTIIEARLLLQLQTENFHRLRRTKSRGDQPAGHQAFPQWAVFSACPVVRASTRSWQFRYVQPVVPSCFLLWETFCFLFRGCNIPEGQRPYSSQNLHHQSPTCGILAASLMLWEQMWQFHFVLGSKCM